MSDRVVLWLHMAMVLIVAVSSLVFSTKIGPMGAAFGGLCMIAIVIHQADRKLTASRTAAQPTP